MLCDYWYFPGISRYIVALCRPLFSGDGPDKFIHSFDHLDPKFKKSIMRKGVIHMFPDWVKKLVLPDTILKDL